MPETKTLDQNIAEANYAKRENEREAAGGGRSLSPSDAAGMGASPDQAKMANFKKPSALDEAMVQAKAQKDVAQEQMFDAIERERNIEEEQLTEEQKTAQKLTKDMEGLGSLDHMVQKATTEAFEKSFQAEVDFDEAKILGMASEGNEDAVKAGIDKFNTDVAAIAALPEADKEAAIEAAYAGIVKMQEDKLFGDDMVDSPMQIISGLMTAIKTDEGTAKLMVAKAFADGIVDPVDMNIDQLEKLGLMDGGTEEAFGLSEDEMEGILGPEWKNTSVNDIAKIVENTVLTEAHKSENLQKALTDPNVSPALKEALQGQQAQIEASGFAAVEQDADQAAAEVLAAGSVMFGGKVQPITELLDDGNIKSMVEEYLNMEDDGKLDSAFAKENPLFANAMDKTFKDAMDAGQTFEEAVDDFKTLQTEVNEETKADADKMGQDIPLRDKVLDIWGRDPTKLKSEKPNNQDGFWQAAMQSDTVMNTINKWDDSTLEKFKEWNDSIDQDSPEGKAQYDAMMNILKDPKKAEAIFDVQNIDDALDAATDTDLLLGVFFGRKGDTDGIQNMNMEQFGQVETKNYLAMAQFQRGPDGKPSSLERVLDANGDGKQDSDEQIKKNIKAVMGSNGSIADMIAKANSTDSMRDETEAGAGIADSPNDKNSVNSRTARDTVVNAGLFKNNEWHIEAMDAHVSSLPDAQAKSMFATTMLSDDFNLDAGAKKYWEDVATNAANEEVAGIQDQWEAPDQSEEIKRRDDLQKNVDTWTGQRDKANDDVKRAQAELDSWANMDLTGLNSFAAQRVTEKRQLAQQAVWGAQNKLTAAQKGVDDWQKQTDASNKSMKEISDGAFTGSRGRLDDLIASGTPQQKAAAQKMLDQYEDQWR